MDDRFGFVILNYRTMDETMDCVKSIDEHIREAHEIVIVDNASPDGSGEKLRQVYDGRDDIKVISRQGWMDVGMWWFLTVIPRSCRTNSVI